VQTGIHRRLSGPERLELAFQLSLAAREMSLARLRKAHPEWSDAQLKRELLRYSFLPRPLPPGIK
jgi:hypothetical protein